MLRFRKSYGDICNLEVFFAEDLDFIKKKTKVIALSSFRSYNNNVPQHLSKGKFDDLKNLFQNKQSVIQKSDKSNSIVIFDRDKCIKTMDNFLSDQSNFHKTVKDDDF